jgi:hypothetical protein
MPSAEDYAKQLLEEANRTLAPHRSGLEEALCGLRNHFLTSLEQISPRILSATSLELPLAGKLIAEAMRETERRAQAGMSRIACFGRELRRQETQEDILDLLLDAAQAFAPRIVLFVQRGGHCVAWSSRGFSDKAAASLQGTAIETSASPALELVARTLSAITIQDSSDESALTTSLGPEAGLPFHVIPMKAMNRMVAVLVTASAADCLTDMNALRILVDLSALYIETLALRLLHEMDAADIPYATVQSAAVPAAEPSATPKATAAVETPLPESPAPQAAAAAMPSAAIPPPPEPPPVAAEPEMSPGPSLEPPREEIPSLEPEAETALPPIPAPETAVDVVSQDMSPALTEAAFLGDVTPENIPGHEAVQEIDLQIPVLDTTPVAEGGIALEEAFKEFIGQSSAEVAEAPGALETPGEAALPEPAEQAVEFESLPPVRMEAALEKVAVPEEVPDITRADYPEPAPGPVSPAEEQAPQVASVAVQLAPEMPEMIPEAPAVIPLPEPEPAAAPVSLEVAPVAVQPVVPVQSPPPIPEPLPARTEAEIEIENLLEAIGRPAPSAGKVEIDLSKEPPPTPIRISAPAPAAERKPTEEEKMHADARRFARLLVSEIKLYNEQRLAEGREKCDVYVRLKRDIDKSREMYEKRVPPVVSRRFDYFNDEVVRILAENDPARMGSDYPGSRVET